MTTEENGLLRLATFERLLRLMPPGRLLDLAAGHGKFSQIGLRLGWQVTAVDARTERMPMTEGIRWIHEDVKQFDVSGHDCIAVLGLLYHLDDPPALLERCAYAPTIIDTHMSPTADVKHLGYWGRWVDEGDCLRSAASNRKSFIPTHKELLRMLNLLYGTVLEVLPNHRAGRTFFLCLPKGTKATGTEAQSENQKGLGRDDEHWSPAGGSPIPIKIDSQLHPLCASVPVASAAPK